MSAAPSAAAPARPAPQHWTVTGVALAATLIAVCVAVGLSAALPANTLTQFAGRDPGPIVDLGLPAVRAIFDVTGAITVGWLIGAVVLAPPTTNGRFDVGGYRCAQAASRSAVVWAMSALALVPLTYANAAGQSIGDAISADGLVIGLQYIDASAAALRSAVAIAFVAIFARAVMRPASASAVLLLALLAMLPLALSGHAAGTDDHDLASDSLIFHLLGVSIWFGGLVAFLGLVRQRVDHLDLIARRYSALALVAFVAVALSGIVNGLLRLESLSYLFSTDYGRLLLVKTVLLVVLGGFGYLQRQTLRRGTAGRRPSLAAAAGGLGDRRDGRDDRCRGRARPHRSATRRHRWSRRTSRSCSASTCLVRRRCSTCSRPGVST